METIDKLEILFANYDKLFEETRENVDERFTHLEYQVNEFFATKVSVESAEYSLNREREKLLIHFDKRQKSDLIWAGDGAAERLENFRPSGKSTLKTGVYLAVLNIRNELSLRKKLRYLNLTNSYKEYELNCLPQECSEIKVLALNRNLIFLYLRTNEKSETVMKLVDQHGREQFRRHVKYAYFYDQFLAVDDKYIVSELYDFDLNKYVLELFDNELNLLASRSFKFMVKLCSIRLNEIICLQYLQQKLIIFDFKLNELMRFDKQLIFGSIDCNLISTSLFGSDSVYVYSLFFDYSIKKILLNVLNKKTVTLESSTAIDLSTSVKSINWLAMSANKTTGDVISDANCSAVMDDVLVKTMPGDKLKLFTRDGHFLEQCVNANIKKFDCLSMCYSNDLYFFDIFKRKIYFI